MPYATYWKSYFQYIFYKRTGPKFSGHKNDGLKSLQLTDMRVIKKTK